MSEQPVDLFRITAAPKCQDGGEGGIRFALGFIACDVPIPEPIELFAVPGRRCFDDDILIEEIAFTRGGHSGCRRCGATHIGIEQPG